MSDEWFITPIYTVANDLQLGALGTEAYNRLMQTHLLFFLGMLILSAPLSIQAQELVQDTTVTMKARVLEVISEETLEVEGTGVMSTDQSLRIEVLDGPEKGSEVIVENDYYVLEKGDVFYLTHTTDGMSGIDLYAVSEPFRLTALLVLGILFVAVVVTFGGIQGIRGLLSLIGSLFFIVFLLLPGIMNGYPPILVAVGVASVIIVGASYITHGFTRTTSVAVFGMILTVTLTGILAYMAIPFAQLSGYTSDETMYLNMNTGGTLNIAGLLIGSMIIGTLGVLYDAAIGQAVAVEELIAAGSHLSPREVYKRAIRIGREHIGALVNTLAIAYVGAALPLLLLFYGYGNGDVLMSINREIFATEIVRTIVGSIGIVLAVPITTAIAVKLLWGRVAAGSARPHHTHSH